MAALLYNYSLTTRIHDIDAAGVMFFARFFYHIHDAYEAFLNQQEQSIKQLLASDIILPISHTEADFKAPVLLNESIKIEIYLQEIKTQEFILSYRLSDSMGKIRATAVTHHVCLDVNNKQRKTLPESICQLLAIKLNK